MDAEARIRAASEFSRPKTGTVMNLQLCRSNGLAVERQTPVDRAREGRGATLAGRPCPTGAARATDRQGRPCERRDRPGRGLARRHVSLQARPHQPVLSCAAQTQADRVQGP